MNKSYREAWVHGGAPIADLAGELASEAMEILRLCAELDAKREFLKKLDGSDEG